MVVCVLLSIILTSKGIQNFYKNVKIALEPKREIEKLRYIMVIHKLHDATVFNRKLGDLELDPVLIGGFLNSIQTFSSEIKDKGTFMRKMEYKDFEILFEQGEYILSALFIDGEESDWLREKLKLFSQEFERNFEDKLKDWKSEVSAFKKSDALIERIFELYRL